jgi:ATP-dependent DNA helicase RecQ
MQERTVQTLMAGRDVAIIMPTGRGNPLCYQLPVPAPALAQTVLLISPPIALIHLQVAQPGGMAIPAALITPALRRRGY